MAAAKAVAPAAAIWRAPRVRVPFAARMQVVAEGLAAALVAAGAPMRPARTSPLFQRSPVVVVSPVGTVAGSLGRYH